jgi:hypothetical protein
MINNFLFKCHCLLLNNTSCYVEPRSAKPLKFPSNLSLLEIKKINDKTFEGIKSSRIQQSTNS